MYQLKQDPNRTKIKDMTLEERRAYKRENIRKRYAFLRENAPQAYAREIEKRREYHRDYYHSHVKYQNLLKKIKTKTTTESNAQQGQDH